jgi:hypothetical protein
MLGRLQLGAVRRLEHQPDAAYFELVLADFAKSIAAGEKKRVVVQLYNAGWHGPENLVVPDATGRTVWNVANVSKAYDLGNLPLDQPLAQVDTLRVL